jgi:uncharacterized CHY-type Zn-finger protein
MLDLDIARLPSEIAKIFMLRGAESPTLQWQEHTNVGAKRALDTLDDARLFGTTTIADEGMAAAVRSLLYLWNGWLGECKMYAQATSERERFHITGFCERMLGNSKPAKEYFQKVGDSPLYPEMHAQALKTIGPGAAPEAHRFRKVLEMIQGWEAYAFCDLYGQACGGQLGTGAVLVVTALQNREFELLFTYCYQAATGIDLGNKKKNKANGEKGSEKKKRAAPRSRSRGSSGPGGAASNRAEKRADGKAAVEAGPQKQAKAAVEGKIKVICPCCREKLTFVASARGQQFACPKCSNKFLIPKKQGAAPSVSPAKKANVVAGGVRILCPKCKGLMAFPDSDRGQRKNCPECGAPFIVPSKQRQAAASS